MKRCLGLLVALTLIVATSAAGQVVGSDHDLSTTNGRAFGTDEVCVFCHTPHNASIAVPLWNHATDATGYSMYTSTTIQGATNTAPEGVSLECMGCHDGVTNLDAYGTNGGTTTIGAVTALVGKDLSDDHPISIEYDNVADPGLNAPTANYVGTLPLYAGTQGAQVECGSCHDPHDVTTATNFLRIDNTVQSALCTTCHGK